MTKTKYKTPVLIRRIAGKGYAFDRMKSYLNSCEHRSQVLLEIMAEFHAVRGKECPAAARLREVMIIVYGDEVRAILGLENVVWKDEKIKIENPHAFVIQIAKLREEGVIKKYSILELARKLLEIFDLPYSERTLCNKLYEYSK